jgi:hypothetical protein
METLKFLFRWPKPRARHLLDVATWPASLVLRTGAALGRAIRRRVAAKPGE